VEFEVNYVPRPITISKACGLCGTARTSCQGLPSRSWKMSMWNFKRQTYAAAAHAMLENIRSNAA